MKTNVNNVEAGHLMAIVTYVKVHRRGYHLLDEKLEVTDIYEAPSSDGQNTISVVGKDLIEKMYSADTWLEEKKVSRTEMIEVLIKSYNLPFTAVFVKANGEERTIRGKLIRPEPLLGRSMVEDMDSPKAKSKKFGLDVEPDGFEIKQIDHRTLKGLIVDGIRYSLNS